MLTPIEKGIFIIALVATIYYTLAGVFKLIKIINQGKGEIDLGIAQRRLLGVIFKVFSQYHTFRFRFIASLFHIFVVWGFSFYLLINLGDILEAYFFDFQFLGPGRIGQIYRLGGDVLSVLALIGMLALIIRRFLFRPSNLRTRDNVLLHPKVRAGISRDSVIVGGTIIFHVGSRFLGESISIASHGADPWQPFATFVSQLWIGWGSSSLTIGEHVGFWFALGSILLFFPYFPYSKHIHLFVAPINYLLRPERNSPGQLDPLDFEDENIEHFGVAYIEQFSWSQLLDAYACIMCYRCQEVCPAYHTGKVLSPATLEINKRYFLNEMGDKIANGEPSGERLIDYAIPEEAVWSCTACGACTDICPTGNDPMRDIMDIRRSLVLMENQFPSQLQTAFRGMERNVNPWNIPPTERMKWAEGLNVPTIEHNPEPDYLWWVGCAPSTDARAQKTARAFAKILNAANVDYAVLGEMESCTGDSARRSGNEYLFYELAQNNVDTLNQINPKIIATTCPHCLHTIKNEYQGFGGEYEIIHHSQLISELLNSGKLNLKGDTAGTKVTFHDPCYLGRQNDIVDEPREIIKQTGAHHTEMPRNQYKSFCCGAGGAQMWKEEEDGEERVSENRIKEARITGAETLAVGCPFCMIMLADANKSEGDVLNVTDVAEIIAAQLEDNSE